MENKLARDIRELHGKILEILNDGGELSKKLPSFEYRQVQKEMAETVFQSYLEECVALIEAGTGTGKTMAYLTPSVFLSRAYGEPVVISTRTINLQEQIMHKDIPLLQKAMEDQFTAVLVKGWSNYLCIRRYHQLKTSDWELSPVEFEFFIKLSEWANNTQGGDKTEIPFEIVESVWDRVNCDPSACLFRKCPHFKRCYFFEVRERMKTANILVTNHALLFSHISMKKDEPDSEAGVFPDFKRLIIDEAHHIEEVATDFLGDEITSTDFNKKLTALFNKRGKDDETGILPRIRKNKFSPGIQKKANNIMDAYLIPRITGLKESANTFFDDIIDANSKEHNSDKLRMTPQWQKALPPYVDESFRIFTDAIYEYTKQLEKLREAISPESPDDFSLELGSSILGLQVYLSSLNRLWAMEEEDFVYSLEFFRKPSYDFVKLKSYPLVVSEILFNDLFRTMKTTILTSATLTINKNFVYIKQQLGLDKYEKDFVLSRIYDSPFDFHKQSILAIPTDMPDYKHENFIPMVVPHLYKLIKIMEGRTFILFTSYDMLRKCGELLKEKLADEGYTILTQGDTSRHIILEQFKSLEKTVLLGTDSFWEGVDVPGRDLECVILMKLPFRVPTDPIIKARSEHLEKEGKNSFYNYSVPQAIIKFKQGFGRLIRNRKDKGVILTLDKRIVEKNYGRAFLKSLPGPRILKGSFAGVVEYIDEWMNPKTDGKPEVKDEDREVAE